MTMDRPYPYDDYDDGTERQCNNCGEDECECLCGSLSDCCGSEIIHSDICNDCREHCDPLGFMETEREWNEPS